jgi:predicted O-methyltransferase YrrM
MLWLFQTEHGDRPRVEWCLVIYLVSFFVCAMTCHGELSRRKPHPSRLTVFYLMISLGGALGGAFVALLAPAVFRSYYEFPLAVAFCAVLAAWATYRVAEWPFRADALGWWSIGLWALCALLLGFTARILRDQVKGHLYVVRNFYGELRVSQYNGVYDWDGYRTLVHGSINHGEQYTHPARRRNPASYYCKDTGLGRYMEARITGNPEKIAVIGLGTGSLAAYSRPGDLFRFYEINPVVEKIAHEYFTYLKDAEGPVEVVLGDARLSLEREPPQDYDLIVLDAFSSDSIPIHLLTREAMALYFRHLRPQGVLAVHISNRYVELEPVLERAATALGKAARVIETEDNEDASCYGTTWVLITSREELFATKEFSEGKVEKLKPAPWLRPWTDDFSNLYRLLK